MKYSHLTLNVILKKALAVVKKSQFDFPVKKPNNKIVKSSFGILTTVLEIKPKYQVL